MPALRRTASVCIKAAFVLLVLVPIAMAASGLPPVENLHMVSGNATYVELHWEEPNLKAGSNITVDKYIIKRDGKTIGTLQGFNGLVETTYVDGAASQQKAVYSVIAVDSIGRRSSPATVAVPAPQKAAPAPSPGGKNPSDVIQSSNLCDAIVSPDVRGNNQPTAFEKYGCGAGMNKVNDDGPGDLFLGLGSKPRPFHDFIENFFIQLPDTLGQTFYLLISAMSIYVMLPSTYLGTAQLFASIMQAFNGNPSYPALIILAFTFAVGVLTLVFLRGQFRKGYQSAAIIVAVLAAMSVLLSNPYHTMHQTVIKPIGLYSGINNQLTDMTVGTDIASQYNLTVHPTYSGNKTYNSIRKSENTDWLMFQYLPQCAINFGDFHWAMTHKVPGTHVTFCERFVQIWGGNFKDLKIKVPSEFKGQITGQIEDKLKDDFKDKLKDANPKVADFFNGGDQTTRLIYSIVSKSALLIHNVLKFFIKLSVLAGIFLLLAEVLCAVVWLFLAMTGTEGSKLTAERRMRTMFHWFKVPAIMVCIGLVEQVVTVNIIASNTSSGFLGLTSKALIWEIVVAAFTIYVFRQMHHSHKVAMEQLGSYRAEPSEHHVRDAGLAIAGAGAVAAWEHWREDKNGSNQRAEGESSESDHSEFGQFQPPESSSSSSEGPNGHVDQEVVNVGAPSESTESTNGNTLSYNIGPERPIQGSDSGSPISNQEHTEHNGDSFSPNSEAPADSKLQDEPDKHPTDLDDRL